MAGKAHAMLCGRDVTTGATLTSATVNVYTPGTVTPIPATMFDKNGGILSNPLTADSVTGLIDFYVNVAQEVDLTIAKAGFTTRTYSNVPVIDDASNELTALLTTTGDIAYASANNTPARLPVGAAGAPLISAAGVPTWSAQVSMPLAGGLTVSTGNTSLQSTSITGSLTISNGLTVTAGNVTITAGTLTVSAGNTSLQSTAVTGSLTISNGLIVTAGTTRLGGLGAFAAGDVYVIADVSGNLHRSGLGPAS